jgi:hypothetical protein
MPAPPLVTVRLVRKAKPPPTRPCRRRRSSRSVWCAKQSPRRRGHTGAAARHGPFGARCKRSADAVLPPPLVMVRLGGSVLAARWPGPEPRAPVSAAVLCAPVPFAAALRALSTTARGVDFGSASRPSFPQRLPQAAVPDAGSVGRVVDEVAVVSCGWLRAATSRGARRGTGLPAPGVPGGRRCRGGFRSAPRRDFTRL